MWKPAAAPLQECGPGASAPEPWEGEQGLGREQHRVASREFMSQLQGLGRQGPILHRLQGLAGQSRDPFVPVESPQYPKNQPEAQPQRRTVSPSPISPPQRGLRRRQATSLSSRTLRGGHPEVEVLQTRRQGLIQSRPCRGPPALRSSGRPGRGGLRPWCSGCCYEPGARRRATCVCACGGRQSCLVLASSAPGPAWPGQWVLGKALNERRIAEVSESEGSPCAVVPWGSQLSLRAATVSC